MKVHILAYILFGSVLITTVTGVTQYELVDLGPGSTASINSSGQIVGTSGDYAVIFDSTGSGANIVLGIGHATAINDNGRIVGLDSRDRLVIFNSWGGVERVLDDKIVPLEINNNDQIVGNTSPSYSAPLGPRAYFLDPVSGYPNYTKTKMDIGRAHSINDSGKVVGYEYWQSIPSGPFEPSEHDWQAVIFDTTGGGMHTYLGTLPGSEEAVAESINEAGQIVGHTFNYINSKQAPQYFGEDFKAVLFDETGGGENLYLGCLEEHVNSKAVAINNSEQIVGYCFSGNDYEYPLTATLFFPDGPEIDLNTVLENPMSGWTLSMATGINDDGWIIGRMQNTSYESHAFLLKPVPEPAMLSSVLLGSVIAIGRRRSRTRS